MNITVNLYDLLIVGGVWWLAERILGPSLRAAGDSLAERLRGKGKDGH